MHLCVDQTSYANVCVYSDRFAFHMIGNADRFDCFTRTSHDVFAALELISC